MRCTVFLLFLLAGAAAAQQPAPAVADEPMGASPQAVVGIFQQACVQTEGQASAAVDWALAQGFEPLNASAEDIAGLLSGQPGSVLVAPVKLGRVLLAAAEGQRCTVWVEQVAGPPLRFAVAGLLRELGAKGARVQLEGERNIERAGAWRNQMQWRYRAVGARQDLSVGVVTTLNAAVATQALNLAPAARMPTGMAPDGMPLR